MGIKTSQLPDGSPVQSTDQVAIVRDGSNYRVRLGVVPQTLTDSPTIAWNMAYGEIATITLAASRIMGLPTNITPGTYLLTTIQGGGGSNTITWNAIFKWEGGTAPVMSTTVGKKDKFSFVYDGVDITGSVLRDVR